MSKFVVVTDTHLGKKDTNEENGLTYRLFKEICSQAKANDIKYLIHLGDFFQGRTLSYKILDYAHSIGKLLSNTFNHTYLVVGNHDIHFKNNIVPNGLSPLFDSFPKIKVIDSPKTLNNKITLFPWLTSQNISDIKSVDTEVLMGHFAINDIPMNRSGSLSENQPLNISDLRRFELVISGHFHQPSINGNIKYLGSPYHMDFNDSGDRGYFIFDDEHHTFDFHKFESPKFNIINVDSENLTEKLIKGNHVRLDFGEKRENINIENIIQTVEDMGALSVKTKFLFASEYNISEEKDVSEIGSNKEIMHDYLNNVEIPKEIDRNNLKSIMDFIYKESIK